MNRSVTVREAAEKDVEGIFKAHNESIRRVCGQYHTPSQIKSWIGNRTPSSYLQGMAAGENLFVAEANGKIAGFSALLSTEVRAVYVHPDYLRQGIGARLYQKLEDAAVAKGARKLSLSSSINAVAFYTSLGFIEIKKTSFRFTDGTEIPCVRMEKSLAE